VALNVTGALGRAPEARGMIAVAGRALSLANEAMTQREIDLARLTGAELHLLNLEAPEGVAFWDFSQAGKLKEGGRKAALAWLASTPLRLGAPWRAAARVRMAGFGRQLERLASRE